MMPASPICVGLDQHQNAADLKVLPQLAGTLQWIPLQDAMAAKAVLVLPGLWLADSPRQATELLRSRSSAGLHTVVVPRFRAGALTSILGSPSSVDITAAEFRSFEWGGEHYAIPGFTVVKTALHVGKWGEAPGVGTVLLAYRPHSVAGAIVLCAATLTNRIVGVATETQKHLLLRIIEAASAPSTAIAESIESIPASSPTSIDEFLDQEHEIGAAYLLSRLAVADPDSADLTEAAQKHLSILLPAEEVVRLRHRAPSAQPGDIRSALLRFGWGAYVRRLSQESEFNIGGLSR